jgi:glycine/D-amino acid oxidase-like deaminating enzyme
MTARRLYDNDMYRFDQLQPSYWEATAGRSDFRCEPLLADDSCEVAIIGGGYTGLSTAYHLAKYHNIEARVLDAGHFGWGASGRNGGFCSIGGSSLGLSRQFRKYGQEHVRHFYQSQVEAVELVRSLIQDERIDAQMVGDAELDVAHSEKAFTELRQRAERQCRLLGLDVDVVTAHQYKREYFDSTEQYGATRLKPTFGLHPMRYLLGLAAASDRQGVKLHRDSEVLAWSKAGSEHLLTTRSATLKSKYVVMAANGYMPESIHPDFYARSLPVISAIVVTRPLTDDERLEHNYRTMTPAINSRKVLNYFRLLPDNRFMFGGRGSSSGQDDAAGKTYDQLVRRLRQLWPAWKNVQIDYRWHGLICMTLRQTPCVGRLPEDPSVFYGFGYHGNGVNTSTWTGKQIADWLACSSLADASVPKALPVMMQGLSGRFPLPALRRHYLQARIALFRLTDWLK